MSTFGVTASNKMLVSTLQELKNVLQDHEVETSTKYIRGPGSGKAFASPEKFTPTPAMHVSWDGDVPYINISGAHRTYICHQGRDNNVYQKKKYAAIRDSMDPIVTRRYKTQTSKKVDCPVKIYVTRIFYLPKYKISEDTKPQRDKCSKKIKRLLSMGEKLMGEEKYMFRLPDDSEHQNHNVGVAAALTEPLDPIVRGKIKELVKEGKRSITIITELLEEFVSKEIGETNRLRRRFYPNRITIRSVVSAAKKELEWSRIDLEKTYTMLSTWEEANLYFRPSTLVTTPVPEEDDGSQDQKLTAMTKTSLLFVYQTYDMKSLFEKYGQNAILLDAAHKTCKCTLPLYFLVVKTNVDYQVAALFITQLETMEALVEGLTIVRDWNPDVTPQYGLVDLVEDEMTALEAVYDDIQVLISSFHRERAWTSWASRKQQSNCLPKEELLVRLRRVAYSSSEEDLHVAVEELKSWELFKKTPLKAYFCKTWMPEVERWALAYKPSDLLFDINTSTAVESTADEDLRYHELQDLQNCSLSELIEGVGNNFLPRRHKLYVQHNVRMMTKHKKYTKDIPEFLHNRPKWFIDHVMQTISAVEEHEGGSVSASSTGVNAFYVSSEYKMYIVNFDVEKKVYSCTCDDFCRTRLLCQHCVMVGIKFPEWSLDRISVWMFDNPIFTYDEDIITPTVDEVDYNNVVIAANEDFPCDDHSSIINDNENEDSSAADVLAQLEMPDKEDSVHVSSKTELIMQCNSAYRSLQSVMEVLPESYLKLIKSQLETAFKDASSKVTVLAHSSRTTTCRTPSGKNRKRK